MKPPFSKSTGGFPAGSLEKPVQSGSIDSNSQPREECQTNGIEEAVKASWNPTGLFVNPKQLPQEQNHRLKSEQFAPGAVYVISLTWTEKDFT